MMAIWWILIILTSLLTGIGVLIVNCINGMLRVFLDRWNLINCAVALFNFIPSGGDLIDSPGVREFHLDNLSDKEILSGFKEFKAFVNQCKFRNCAHINEPNCAVKNALEAGVKLKKS
jgi:hypothetical protein